MHPETSNQPGGRVVRRDRRRDAYEMAGGTLTVSTAKRHRVRLGPPGSADQNDPDTIEEFVASLRYLPSGRSGRHHMFQATITQQSARDGISSSIPRLQVNLVLPSDTLVFQLVRDGLVHEFEALLRERKAFLRAHDELGNSLLAVSRAHFTLSTSVHLLVLAWRVRLI